MSLLEVNCLNWALVWTVVGHAPSSEGQSHCGHTEEDVRYMHRAAAGLELGLFQQGFKTSNA